MPQAETIQTLIWTQVIRNRTSDQGHLHMVIWKIINSHDRIDSNFYNVFLLKNITLFAANIRIYLLKFLQYPSVIIWYYFFM